MSFLGSIFGGKRKHEEKMEKIHRDEMKNHDKEMVDLELAKHGINPHGSGAAAVLGGATGFVGAATPGVLAALGVPGGGGGFNLGNLFGGKDKPGQPGGGGQQQMLLLAGAAVLLLLLFKRK